MCNLQGSEDCRVGSCWEVPVKGPVIRQIHVGRVSAGADAIGKEMREGLKRIHEGLRSITIGAEVFLNRQRHKIREESEKQTERVDGTGRVVASNGGTGQSMKGHPRVLGWRAVERNL